MLLLHDVVVVWPGSCNNVSLGHAPKARNMLRPTMLQYVASKFAIVWLELEKTGFTMLRYVELS